MLTFNVSELIGFVLPLHCQYRGSGLVPLMGTIEGQVKAEVA
jgi:hypothetical protein